MVDLRAVEIQHPIEAKPTIDAIDYTHCTLVDETKDSIR